MSERFRRGPAPAEPFRDLGVGDEFFVEIEGEDKDREISRLRTRAQYFIRQLSKERGLKVAFTTKVHRGKKVGVTVRRIE